MAQSQLHPGLMVVPWFNSHEWRYVKDCIFGDDVKKKEGLAIMKLWKERTSNLSSGVEGTLILLTALVDDIQHKYNERRHRCYCYALLRFLNIVCGPDGKQGTFYRSAKKYQIPDWIIDIRHALAHGKTVPGELEIQNALGVCLNWVKKVYWVEQDKCLDDYITEDTSGTAILLADLYCNITIDSFLNKRANTIKDLEIIDSNLPQKTELFLNYCSVELSGKIDDCKNTVLHNLKCYLNDCVDEHTVEEIAKIVVKYLYSEQLPDLSIVDCVPNELEIIWKELIYLCYTEKILLTLIRELSKSCSSSQFYELSDNSLKLASLWLKFIFQMLLGEGDYVGTSDEEMLEDEEADLHEYRNEIINEIDDLEATTLSNANMFTSLYLRSLLELGGRSESYIQSKVHYVEEQLRNRVANEDQYTSHKPSEVSKDIIMFDATDNRTSTPLLINDSSETSQFSQTNIPHKLNARPRCVLLKDSSKFENCPLGVLPTQNRKYNPLISFNY